MIGQECFRSVPHEENAGRMKCAWWLQNTRPEIHTLFHPCRFEQCARFGGFG